jgi:hypothetical protein
MEAKTLYVGDAQRVATKGRADESRPVHKEVASVRRIKLVLGVGAVMVAALMAFAAPAMALDRDVEQEADSGDVDQSFEVSGGDDNSNQTVSIQGVANTGNTQNAIGVSDGTGFFDDDDFFFDEDEFFFFGDFDGDRFDEGWEFEDVGASIELSPEQVVTSDQEVNQAATATD